MVYPASTAWTQFTDPVISQHWPSSQAVRFDPANQRGTACSMRAQASAKVSQKTNMALVAFILHAFCLNRIPEAAAIALLVISAAVDLRR